MKNTSNFALGCRCLCLLLLLGAVAQATEPPACSTVYDNNKLSDRHVAEPWIQEFGFRSEFQLAQTNQCSCVGATMSTHEISCKGADGKEFKKTQVCWTKKMLGTNQECGTFCDSEYSVCNGTARGVC
jgi:hypothetical protein